MKVLLTGGSGFLGSHIAEQLSQAGQSVRALVRRSSDTRLLASLPNVELTYGALDDTESLKRAASGVSHVIHAAGAVKAHSAAEFHRINAGGTVNLLRAITKVAPELERFVLVSSLTVCGPSTDGRPVSMTAKANPLTEYGRSKLAAERAVLAEAASLPVTILRPCTIYGPRDTEVLAFFKAVKMGVLPITSSPNQGLSTIFGSDCAAGCVSALTAQVKSGSVYCLEDGETHSLKELVELIEQALSKRVWVRVRVPRAVLLGAAVASELYGRASGKAVMLTRDKCNELLAPHWLCDASDARRALSWSPKVPFARGARITAEWYRREGWL